jgi:hypothetical protein
MKHRQNSPLENMHALLECMFVDYANQLRATYPHRKIRNTTVFASAIPAFAHFGYIKLVRKTSIPKDIPEFLINTIKRSKEDAIWIPSKNFPRNTFDLYREMKPYMRGDAVLWRHLASENSKDRSTQGNEQNEISS